MGLVAALRAEGVVVRVLDLRPHPDPQVDSRVGDIAAPGVADSACEGMDVVFHAAARIDWSLNKRAQLQRANVEGTERVIAACIARGVGRLVYTSSVDVMSGGGPIDGGDEG
jgi:nucleoside-diphosphate-sugar epimerase